MPGFNKRGPMGEGPMTGRKQGRCTNFGKGRQTNDENDNHPEEQQWGENSGRGAGRGAGFGRGHRNRFRGAE
jgi:hypothetical protein